MLKHDLEKCHTSYQDMNPSVQQQASYEVTVQSTARRIAATMPYVEVHMIEGRTDEQRAKIAKSFTDTLVQVLGVKPADVWIQFIDMPKTHFAISGVLRSKK